MAEGGAGGARRFPFSAVVGMDDVKLALLLAAVDPAVGGVLLRGEKGSAKTTLARGLAALLPGEAPFAELPLGATEDRLVGSLDLRAALVDGATRFEPGLLTAAHGGVLYVDEVNLLPDHLVDVLLDVAASGVNRVEREGVSHVHPSRFVLVGSMNPEEGELRPQLLDRFGLCVDVAAPRSSDERVEVVRRRLAFDSDADGHAAEDRWTAEDTALADRLARAAKEPVDLPDQVVARASALAVAVGAEGLRADLVLCRAAAAHAAWQERATATDDDLRRVAPLVLAHRRRRSPFEDLGLDPSELDQAWEDSSDAPPEAASEGSGAERVADPGDPHRVAPLGPAGRQQSGPAGRRAVQQGERGRLVGTRPATAATRSVAVGSTVRAAARRRAGGSEEPALVADDVHEAVRQERSGTLLVVAVDASGSMGVEARMEAVKTAVLSLLLDAYQRRDQVSVVTFRGDDATVALQPTSSVEVARARLAELPTGGTTPLAAGIDAARAVAERAAAAGSARTPLLVVVTDGRATRPDPDPVEAALAAAAEVGRRHLDSVVIDAEQGGGRLGLARRVADAMGGRLLTLDDLAAGTLPTVLA